MPYTPSPTPLATTAPVSESTIPVIGSVEAAARSDHQHPRLTSTTMVTLDANNEAVVTFTRTFSKKPGLAITFEESVDGMPISFKVKTWATDGSGNYTGCVIKGYRATLLPTLSGIILIGPLISALSNLNIFGGSAQGISVSVIAVQQSS